MQSVNGAIITANSGDMLTDAAGNQWGITQGQVTVNGSADPTTRNVLELAYTNGLIWQQNTSLTWWSKSSPTASWDPPQGSSAGPPQPADDVIAGVDANGNASAIADANGVSWSVVKGQVAANGVADPTTANVRELAIINGQVWQENANNLWWTKAAPGDPWTSPAGPGGTAVNPLNGPIFTVIAPPGGPIADPVQVGDITGSDSGGAQGASSITTPFFIGSINTGGVHLVHAAFGLSELSAGSGPLIINGDSDLEAGSEIALRLLGTGGLPPGSLENNGTMTVSSSTLLAGNVTGSGMISVMGNGSTLTAETISATQAVALHSANVDVERPTSAPSAFQATFDFDPNSTVTSSTIGAASEMFIPGSTTGGELMLFSAGGSLTADLQVTGVPEVYASVQSNGTTLLTPYDTGHSVQADGFAVTDVTTGVKSGSTGSAYNGPVQSLQHQFIDVTPDNLNIAATAPNSFILAGSGMNSIDVSHAGGNNIIDGGTGSAFMTGGSGQDDFFLDERTSAEPTFSTMAGFHSGDNAVVWGVDPSVFTMHALDGQGAAGATGLDLVFTAPGHVSTSFVLAGYSSADLTNGRLSVSFGRTADSPGLPGSAFVDVQGH